MNYEKRFAAAEAHGEENAYTRIDDNHPVDFFMGLDSSDRAIMFLCSECPPEPPSLAAIRVEVRLRNDGIWALVLRLRQPELKALFNRLIEDLDWTLRQQPVNPGETVMARLARWQRLLSRGPLDLLGDNELRGLCAELSFLQEEAFRISGLGPAVGAWEGPKDAPKDFVFPFAEVEIKAIHQQARELTISSLEQLTDTGKPLFLWTRVVKLGNALHPDRNSVAALVGNIRNAINIDPNAAEEFETRLRLAGYWDRPEYTTRVVFLGPTECYRVSLGFPRIERPSVPFGVLSCQYCLQVASLAKFRVKTWHHEAP